MDVVSQEISNLLRYLPDYLAHSTIYDWYLYCNFVRKAIIGTFESFDLGNAKIIGNLVFYLIAILVTITALNQAGIDTDIITNNVTIILGAFLLAIALAFGFGLKKLYKAFCFHSIHEKITK